MCLQNWLFSLSPTLSPLQLGECYMHGHVVDASCLETLKVRLDRALSSLIELKRSLLIAEELD